LINIRRISNNAFLRDALSLGGGTAVAQVITIATLPILTRIYTPGEFGVFALYIALSSFLSVFASLKLEQVIMLPKTDRDAGRVLVAILIASTIFSLAILGVLVLAGDSILALMAKDEDKSRLYMLPVSVFLIAIYQAQRFWQIRQTNYKLVSLALVCGIAINALVSISIGVWGRPLFTGADGLVLGYVCQGLVSVVILTKGFGKYLNSFFSISISQIVGAIAPYRKLAAALLMSQGIASSTWHIPTLAIGRLFDSTALGFYSMAERVILGPLVLIANALGDVYRQRAANAWRETGRFDAIYWKTLMLSSSIGIPVFSVGIIVTPDLFAFVFGDQWRIAGVYAQIMLVAELIGFITTPVDKGAVIVGATKFIVLWNLAKLAGVVVIIAGAFVFSLSIYAVIWLLALNRIITYLVNVRFEYKFSIGGFQEG